MATKLGFFICHLARRLFHRCCVKWELVLFHYMNFKLFYSTYKASKAFALIISFRNVIVTYMFLTFRHFTKILVVILHAHYFYFLRHSMDDWSLNIKLFCLFKYYLHSDGYDLEHKGDWFVYLAGLVILLMRWQGCGGIGNGIITSARR